jgi:hypothetical protein
MYATFLLVIVFLAAFFRFSHFSDDVSEYELKPKPQRKGDNNKKK